MIKSLERLVIDEKPFFSENLRVWGYVGRRLFPRLDSEVYLFYIDKSEITPFSWGEQQIKYVVGLYELIKEGESD